MAPTEPPEPILHDTILPTNQVPWITYYKKNLRKEMVPPMEHNEKLRNPCDKVPVDKEKYRRLVGKLIYLSHTRPDISYAVSIVSQSMQAPYEEQMEAVNCTLRYLKTTPGKGLMFRKTYRKCTELIPTLIEQNQLLTNSPLQDIVPLCGVILLLG